MASFADRFADVDEVIHFQVASSFGNAFADLDDADRARMRAAMDRGLDAHRLADSAIQLRRNSIFAVAAKD